MCSCLNHFSPASIILGHKTFLQYKSVPEELGWSILIYYGSKTSEENLVTLRLLCTTVWFQSSSAEYLVAMRRVSVALRGSVTPPIRPSLSGRPPHLLQMMDFLYLHFVFVCSCIFVRNSSSISYGKDSLGR